MLEEPFVFDADRHWSEPADLGPSRPPAQVRDRVSHVETCVHPDPLPAVEERVATLTPEMPTPAIRAKIMGENENARKLGRP